MSLFWIVPKFNLTVCLIPLNEKELKIIWTVFMQVPMKWPYNIKMGQRYDSAPSLSYTVISLDSPHMHEDSYNYLKFLLGLIPCAIEWFPSEIYLSN